MTTTILNRIMMAAVAILFPAIAFAQESADTIAALELQEIVIEAPKVIRKADMDVYHPSKSAVENSKNGMQLLNNLMIPSLSVSDALGSIQAAGQSVQIRINGRESSIDQVRTLLPETIKRVEWIDNPGLRYGGANYVLNIIVNNPTVGGSLMAQARPALNQAWGFTWPTPSLIQVARNGRSVEISNSPTKLKVTGIIRKLSHIPTDNPSHVMKLRLEALWIILWPTYGHHTTILNLTLPY